MLIDGFGAVSEMFGAATHDAGPAPRFSALFPLTWKVVSASGSLGLATSVGMDWIASHRETTLIDELLAQPLPASMF